jgi:hypothetical protein
VDDWYKAYLEYLNSEAWQAKKEFFKSDCIRLKLLRELYGRDVCEVCHTATAFEVHHLHYATLGSESYEDLVLLCEDCHRDISKLAKMRKVSNGVATFIMYRAYEPIRYVKQEQATKRQSARGTR